MRQLFPAPIQDVDPVAIYGRQAAIASDRPAVRFNMITSADGATALSGRSGALGGPADKMLFGALRSLADMILVGAGTMRTEHYGPASLAPETRRRRQAEGLPPVPPIAVITRSCDLDWTSPFFTEAEERPVVVTTESASSGHRERAASVADVVIAGTASVEPAHALAALAARGASNVLLEGGPAINGQFAAENLLDELCLTLAPMLVGGDSTRLLGQASLSVATELQIAHVLEDDGYLFLHYQRRGHG